MNQRETWTGRIGFILACVGAAIGLGNIWMFSWRLGAYGGAAFLVPYFIFVFGLASTGLMEEFAFGRSQQKGAIGAFENVFKDKNPSLGATLGTLPVLGVSGVFIFYIIVVGWILKYFVLALTNSFVGMDIANYFGQFAGNSASILWHALAVILTLAIVKLGVQKGIEKTNKFMMPTLFILLIILMIRSLTLGGAMEGVKFMLVPDWSKLLQPVTWVMALGQAFFTVSLGGAAMLVYGSYLRKDEDIPSSALQTVAFNTSASLLAAFVIIPAVFAFGLDPQAGPPLLFITLPNIFKAMPGGYIFGVLFFLSIVFAAISSAVNLMEVPVEAMMDRLNLSRGKSTLIVALLGFIIGLPLDTNMAWFGKFADFVTIYLVPIGAVLAAFVFFWVYGVSKARQEINRGSSRPLGKWWEPFAKYVFVAVALIVLILGVVYGGIG
ncbi:sodium-dependent transporter [Halothermothrix orenii]|uniref:Sodium:neurotransmitter symporter n=1 Tax=Halothermothrix orenii (strain H 168 / OCM 544 / DSM 9562) TaxID=373903 RepID=B8CZY4_HALOH|nr:sodium-dependent transporter [Halothermothrix orenii]ACL70836.1 sodium:neurotransmitter symporter [Halothermothrix orenii H 168]